MSDPNRVWQFYIQDMLEFAERTQTYTNGLTRDTFFSDRLVYDATVRNVALIGEAATHIPSNVRVTEPIIPWRKIIGMRNRLIHAYLGIEDDDLWAAITIHIPKLIPELRRLLDSNPIPVP